jgi:GNAT superfamily N-acetyltransferase
MSEAAGHSAVEIRSATAADVGTILEFIRDLARYERLEHKAVATADDIHRWLFGDVRIAEVLLAIDAGEPVGFALFFVNFSTFLGRPGIYLEDLFVRETARGRGVGQALMRALAAIAVTRGYGRLEWAVLDWNAPAIEFYRRLGADLLEDWRICRLTGAALDRLGSGSG